MIVAAKIIAVKILSKYDVDGDGNINPEELITIGNKITTKESLDDVEPHFWFDRPWVMGVFLKALMFQNAISVATGMFYVLYFGQKNNCYMASRSWTDVIVSTLIGLLVLFHHGTVLLPSYALVMHLGNHRELNDFLSRMHKSAGKRLSRIVGKGSSHGDGGHGHGGSKVHPEVDTLQAIRAEFGADSQEYKDALQDAANAKKQEKEKAIDTRTMQVSTSRTENQAMDVKKEHGSQSNQS